MSVQQKPFFVAVVALPPFSVEPQGSTSFGVSVGGHRWDPIVAVAVAAGVVVATVEAAPFELLGDPSAVVAFASVVVVAVGFETGFLAGHSAFEPAEPWSSML